MSKQNCSRFSTVDSDNDNWTSNCAEQSHGAGWWFDACHDALLTGPYHHQAKIGGNKRGIEWETWKHEQLMKVEMKIRPIMSKGNPKFPN